MAIHTSYAQVPNPSVTSTGSEKLNIQFYVPENKRLPIPMLPYDAVLPYLMQSSEKAPLLDPSRTASLPAIRLLLAPEAQSFLKVLAVHSDMRGLNVSHYLKNPQMSTSDTKGINVSYYWKATDHNLSHEHPPIDNNRTSQRLGQHEHSSTITIPAHFGIGSYFPGYTSTGSCVSFHSIPNLIDHVPALRGMIDENPPHMKQWRSITESENVRMMPTVHCAHTFAWKKKLIAAAKHNVVISGNYCGQHAFDEILELIGEKLAGNEHLKVVIISSPNFVKDDPKKNIRNQTLIDDLKTRYPSQFSVVYSPDVWVLGTDDVSKKSTNHIKYFGIDWGRYYIMGGSAIKDNFNMSGTDNIFDVLSEEENVQFADLQKKLSDLKNEWERPHPNRVIIEEKNQKCIHAGEAIDRALRNSPHFSIELVPILEKLSSILQFIRYTTTQQVPLEFYSQNADQLNLSLQSKIENGVQDNGLVGMFVPGNFRDMDFVFSDPNDGYSSGRQLFLEMVRMAYRTETLNAVHENNPDISFFTPTEVADLPIFTGNMAQHPESKDSVTHRIMRNPMPKCCELQTQEFTDLEQNPTGSLQMLYQGPEQPSYTNGYYSKMLELIRNAKRRIVFNHMYFCPTGKIMEALKEAIEERNVQVEIITCANTENSPWSQKTFGPHNKWNWLRLTNLLAPEFRQNLKVFLFMQNKKGLHKKVVVFDDQIVLAGSSNCGYKSLVTSSDHEVNFVAKSEAFAQQTLAVCEEDKKLSRAVPDTTKISLREHLQALIYCALKFLLN